MNEKIDDLAMQAGVNTWKMIEVGFVSFEEHELEKFVELIVLECGKAEALAQSYDHDYIMKSIKEHFGIKI